MNILVTFAIRSEIGVWPKSSETARHVRVVMTGMGMRKPQDELRQALANSDFCIASGLAGSLNRRHKVGSIVVARGIRAAGKTTIVTADGGLIDAAVRCSATPVDFLYTSDRIANSLNERAELAKAADAVDMESFHVLTEARRAGVPAVAIRAISDSPDRRLPIDFSKLMNERGDMAWTRLIGELIRHPLRVGDFVKFGMDTSAAIRNLTTFLDRYVKFLAVNKDSFHAPAQQSFG
jgi:nucleoside phosphorylase